MKVIDPATPWALQIPCQKNSGCGSVLEINKDDLRPPKRKGLSFKVECPICKRLIIVPRKSIPEGIQRFLLLRR